MKNSLKVVLFLQRHLSQNNYLVVRCIWRKFLHIKKVFKWLKWKGRGRIFCISYQKTGTTSVKDFFDYFGYVTCSWSTSQYQKWPRYWFDGNFEAIFSSLDFKSSQVFDDDPWFYPEFYKYLFHRFPKARFVLFTRNSDAWFASMSNYRDGYNLGNTQIHCKVYRREIEFYKSLDHDATFQPRKDEVDRLMKLSGHEQHYKDIYETRNREVVEFFNQNDPDRLFTCSLEDPDKWQKMGAFFNIKVPKDFEMHSNRTIKKR